MSPGRIFTVSPPQRSRRGSSVSAAERPPPEAAGLGALHGGLPRAADTGTGAPGAGVGWGLPRELRSRGTWRHKLEREESASIGVLFCGAGAMLLPGIHFCGGIRG